MYTMRRSIMVLNRNCEVLFHGVDSYTQMGLISLLNESRVANHNIVIKFVTEKVMREQCFCSFDSNSIYIVLTKNRTTLRNAVCLDDELKSLSNKIKMLISTKMRQHCWLCNSLQNITIKEMELLKHLNNKDLARASKLMNVSIKTNYSRLSKLQSKLRFNKMINLKLWLISQNL